MRLTAAGAAGLLKVLLALEHQTLPPTANFERTSPKCVARLQAHSESSSKASPGQKGMQASRAARRQRLWLRRYQCTRSDRGMD